MFFRQVEGDLFTDREHVLEVLTDVLYRLAAIEVGRALKVQVQAPEIHVDGPDDRDLIIAKVLLCMDETGRVLVDADARMDQAFVVRLRQQEDTLLIRDTRGDDAHIHAALRRHTEFAVHLLTDDEVGRRDVYMMLRRLDDVHVNIFPEGLMVDRRIRVRLHVGVLLLRFVCVRHQVVRHGQVGLLDEIPHFEEHQRVVADRIALEADAAVLPVSVRRLEIEVFIRQIKAAGETDLVIDDHDLTMVAVVHEHVDKRDERIEDPALDAVAVHSFREVLIDELQASEVVVDHADLDALLHLADQDLLHRLPDLRVLDGEILEEDELLRTPKRRKHILQRFLRRRVELNVGILIGRICSVLVNVIHLPVDVPRQVVVRRQAALKLCQVVEVLSLDLDIVFFRLSVDTGSAKHRKQTKPEYGDRQNDEDPYQTIGDIIPFYCDSQSDQYSQYIQQQREVKIVSRQQPRRPDHKQDLQQQTETGIKCSTKYNLQYFFHCLTKILSGLVDPCPLSAHHASLILSKNRENGKRRDISYSSCMN